MKELLLTSFDGVSYGIWKEGIGAIDTVKTSRRLSMARAGFVTLSVVGDHTETLADLAVCLGHPEAAVDGPAFVVRPSSTGGISGFLVRGRITSIPVDSEDCVPLPCFLRTPVIDSCMIGGSIPVPLIDLPALGTWLLAAGAGARTRDSALPAGGEVDARVARGFRVFAVSGSIFAAVCGEGTDGPSLPVQPVRMPFLPPWVKGITVSRGRILPVVDVARRLAVGQAGQECQTVMACTGEEDVALLVDEDRGLWQCGQAEVRDLPPIVRTPWMRTAVVRDGCVAPVLEPGMLVSRRGDEAAEELPPDIHVPDSPFSSLFNRTVVDVLEFSLLGSTHAVPQCETEGTVPLGILTEIPFARKIVAGVTEHEGEILPVVDLARIYGGSHRAVRGMPLILVRNGTFGALVMAGETVGARRVELASQRAVPVVLPYPALYGCYIVENSVRLVLNVEAIAVHVDPAQAAPLWSAIPHAPLPEKERSAPLAGSDDATPITAGSRTGPEAPAEAVSAAGAAETPSPTPPTPEPAPHGVVQETPQPPAPARPIQEQPVSRLPLPEQPGPSLPEIEPDAGEVPATKQPEPVADAVRSDTVASRPGGTGNAEILPDPGAEAMAREAQESGLPSADRPDGRHALSIRRRRSRRTAFLAAAGFLALGLAAALLFTRPAGTNGPAQIPPAQVSPAPDAGQPPADAGASSRLQIVVPAEGATDAEIYVVVRGDTLWSISERLTGNPFTYVRIAGENRIADPDLIFPGQRIRIIRK